MKKITTLFIFIITVFSVLSCGKNNPDMTINLYQDSIEIDVITAATLIYEAEYNIEEINVMLKNADPLIFISSSFDSKSGMGEVTFAPTLAKGGTYNSSLVFTDGKTTIEKNIKIIVDNWNILPDEPIEN